jgi:hypothetical protein
MTPHTLKVKPQPLRYRVLVYSVCACAATTGIAALLLRVFDLSNVVMAFLLTVVLVALRWGRAAGALAAFVAVLSFDFFFVPPVWSFRVSDTQYVFTFLLMLVVGHGRHLAVTNLVNIAHSLTGPLSVALEYWRQDNHDPSGRVKQESADIAFTYLASPDLQLDVGANIGVNRATPDHQLYAGMSYRW